MALTTLSDGRKQMIRRQNEAISLCQSETITHNLTEQETDTTKRMTTTIITMGTPTTWEKQLQGGDIIHRIIAQQTT